MTQEHLIKGTPFPNNTKDLQEIIEQRKQYFADPGSAHLDYWGNPIQCRYDAKSAQVIFTSHGPNGLYEDGSGDDMQAKYDVGPDKTPHGTKTDEEEG